MTFCQQADPEKALDFSIRIENFLYCDNIGISRPLSMMSSYIIHVELQDTKRRSLILNVKVSFEPGGSLRVSDLIEKSKITVGNRKLMQQRRRRLRCFKLYSAFSVSFDSSNVGTFFSGFVF